MGTLDYGMASGMRWFMTPEKLEKEHAGTLYWRERGYTQY